MPLPEGKMRKTGRRKQLPTYAEVQTAVPRSTVLTLKRVMKAFGKRGDLQAVNELNWKRGPAVKKMKVPR